MFLVEFRTTSKGWNEAKTKIDGSRTKGESCFCHSDVPDHNGATTDSSAITKRSIPSST